MNSNVGVQNTGLVAWDGLTAYPRDISNHAQFGFVFEVTAAIVADAIFDVMSYPPSAGDPCVPGAGSQVDDLGICQTPGVPAGTPASFTIPAGTPIGTVLAGTIPCRPDKFVGLAADSGDTANVKAVMILQGPKY